MGDEGRRYRYDDAWEETVRLSDGQRVLLRTLRPSDKQLFLDAFERLSPDSRYARFMAPKAKLSEEELRYLTEVDGVNHFAIGALRRHLVAKDEGVGSARFVRLPDRPDTAEPAVTVVDDYQKKGLGTILLQRLIEAAWERDIRWFCSELLAENNASRRMIESLSPDVKFRPAGNGAVVCELPLPEPDRTPTEPGFFAGTPIQQLLSQIARAAISVRPRLMRPPQPPSQDA
jgi:GNAT superfamily N-acetyltransferase